MDGVVVFADNNVLDIDSFENKLFNMLREESSFTILPVCSIYDLESTIKATSTFKAIILDWNFKNEEIGEEELDGVELPDTTPEQLLNKVEIYSLIYIYSENELGVETKNRLNERYHEKVQFKKKSVDAISVDTATIIKDINDFDEANKHMRIPFIWSHAINQSAQRIFYDLEIANKYWIKEIKDSVLKDGGDPTSELIEMFHNLLNESLIQDVTLRDEIEKYNPEQHEVVEENTIKLYRRIFYTVVPENAPLMTGDIFKFNENDYGILITPECDLASRKRNHKDTFEFLMIDRSSSQKFQEEKKKNPSSANSEFNNGVISRHVLASFPFENDKYNDIAVINFALAMYVIKEDSDNNLLGKRCGYKLNSPYIHQLRQRYVAFIGRYGVPAIPNSVRNHYWR